MLLVSSRWRPGGLLTLLQCNASLHHKGMHPNVSSGEPVPWRHSISGGHVCLALQDSMASWGDRTGTAGLMGEWVLGNSGVAPAP